LINYFITTFLIATILAITGCGGGGGGGGASSSAAATATVHGSLSLTVDADDALVADGETNSFKTGEYNNQIGLAAINAAEAYQSLEDQSKSIAGDGIIIGISDNGVDLEHREIADNASSSGQLNGTLTSELGDHGTHVASTAAGVRDGAFMHGVAFNATILSANVFDSSSGASFAGISSLASGGATVVNMSWSVNSATTFNSSSYNSVLPLFSSDFASAISNDVVLVAAAGNDADSTKMSMPAIFAADSSLNGQMIAVIALDENNDLASFSNTCAQAKNFCLAAPGTSIYAAIHQSPFYDTYQGTSMAAPHVSGAAAVLRAAWPSLSASETVAILLDTATDLGDAGVDDTFGYGLLNLEAAVLPVGTSSLVAGGSVTSSGYNVASSSITINPIFGNAYSKNLAPILKNAVFFDKYGRDYKANLDQKITNNSSNSYSLDNLFFNNYSSAALPVSFGESYSNSLMVKFNATNIFSDPISGETKHNKFGLKYLTVDNSSESQNDFNSSDVAFSYNKNFGSNLKIGFNKNDLTNDFSWDNPAQNYHLISYNNFASSPYKNLSVANFTSDGESNVNSNQLNIAQIITPNLTTNLSYTSYNQSNSINKFSGDESRIFETGLIYKLNSKTKLGFNFGNLKELNNNFLGSDAQGAFSGGSNPQTKYVALNFTRNLVDSWQLTTSYSQGKTNVSGNNLGVFRDFNDIQSRGLAVRLLNSNFFNGRFAVVYSEPLRVYKGTTNIDIPISRDSEGNVQRLTVNNVSLVPDGKEKDLEFSYSFILKENGAQIDLNSIIQQEPNNIKDAKSQYVWMAMYNLKF